ncbi:hypothetical protein CL654_01520 [bacterium]|nr:hypothetical protein [bacterium]|tara:strand:- start:6941 stop:7315 length:375 start_codon:yes stop_codon:yes gene_type:complete
MFHGFQGVRRRKNLKQLFWVVVLLALIFWAGEGVWGQYKKNRLVDEVYTEANLELTALLEREKELQEELDRLGNARGVEEELRTKFHIAKPGEKTVVIVDAKDSDTGEGDTKGFWGSIKAFFGF